jgi:hypothetical protein
LIAMSRRGVVGQEKDEIRPVSSHAFGTWLGVSVPGSGSSPVATPLIANNFGMALAGPSRRKVSSTSR